MGKWEITTREFRCKDISDKAIVLYEKNPKPIDLTNQMRFSDLKLYHNGHASIVDVCISQKYEEGKRLLINQLPKIFMD